MEIEPTQEKVDTATHPTQALLAQHDHDFHVKDQLKMHLVNENTKQNMIDVKKFKIPSSLNNIKNIKIVF